MKAQRFVLGTALVGMLFLSACSSAGEGGQSDGGGSETSPTPVNFVLNYTPGPQHEEFVVAVNDGFYEDAGLDVTMTSPAATTDPIKLVAGGSADIGVGYAGDVVAAAAEGVPITAVATIHRRIALGLLSKPGSGIETPQDLIGKTVGLTAIPQNNAMFNELLAANDIDPSEVNVVPVGFNGPQLVASGEIDAADAVSWYENGVYEQLTGDVPTYLEFTDFGVPDGYFMTLITSNRYLAENPETVQKFVEATLKAEKWTIENPEEAQSILLENVEDVTPEFAVNSRRILNTVIVDDVSQKQGLGWSDPDVWQQQADFYLKSGQITKAVDTSAIFTNDYLPAKAITVDVPTE